MLHLVAASALAAGQWSYAYYGNDNTCTTVGKSITVEGKKGEVTTVNIGECMSSKYIVGGKTESQWSMKVTSCDADANGRLTNVIEYASKDCSGTGAAQTDRDYKDGACVGPYDDSFRKLTLTGCPEPADPCFPATARVTLADGTQKQIDQLSEGDAILAATLEGGLALDTVSLLSIADKTAKSKRFRQVTTDGKLSLNATSEHHVATGAKCCSQIKKLGELKVGDTLWAREAGKPLPVAQKIISVKDVVTDGLHSPVLTNGGLPIVNHIVTAFDTESKVRTAKTWLPPLISLCKKTGTCDMAKNFFDYSDKKHIVR